MNQSNQSNQEGQHKQPIATTNSHPDHYHNAQTTIERITLVITQIRSIDSFTPLPSKELVQKCLRKLNNNSNNSNNNNNNDDDESIVYIFEHFIKNTTSDGLLIINNNNNDLDQYQFNHNHNKDNNRQSFNIHPLEKDRYQLVHLIFIPLLQSLAKTYKIIDDDNNNEDKQEESQQEEEQRSSIIQSSTGSKQKTKIKPKAPRGLLSLTNYTDVASLLELTVCTSIIPLLESYIVLDIKDRIRQCLPKSLQGRLRKKSLEWGIDVVQYVKRKEEANKSSSHKVQNAIQKIRKAKQELSLVINAITQVILLDRFRPMLLPRHITDVYAVLFQLERLNDLETKLIAMMMDNNNGHDDNYFNEKQNNDDDMKRNNNTKWLYDFFLGEKNDTYDDCNNKQQYHHFTQNIQPIDIHTKVKSFQSLLLSGKKTPPWLRSRVGKLLTEIATHDDIEGLQSIIDIFVVAASSLPTEEMTGASSRLGRVLCGLDVKKDMQYYNLLLKQFVKILDGIIVDMPNMAKSNVQNTGELNARSVAVILTVWAVLEHLPSEITTKYFFVQLSEGLYPGRNNDQTSSIKLSIGRILILLMYTPPGGDRDTNHVLNQFVQFILSSSNLSIFTDDTQHISFQSAPGLTSPFGQLLRIACAEGNKVIQCSDVIMASDTMKMIVYTIITKCKLDFNKDNITNKCSLEMTAATAMIQSVLLSPFDLMQYQFYRSENLAIGHGEVAMLKRNQIDSIESDLIKAIEDRAQFVVHNLVDVKHTDLNNYLPGAMFQILLLIYFDSNKKDSNISSSDLLPEGIRKNIDEFKVVSMMMLPILCEQYSPDLLFKDDGSDSNGIIHIVDLIISTIATQFKAEKNVNDPSKQNDSDTQLSIVSIVLSLLVAMLELGSQKRSIAEETALKSMLPSLQALTTLTDTHVFSPNLYASDTENMERSKLAVIRSEIAEMASHAMAIIFSRSTLDEEKNDDDIIDNLSHADYFSKVISDAENQLLSDQPPLRARAMVQLRQLARGRLEELKNSNESKGKGTSNPLIMEIDGIVSVATDVNPLVIVTDMLRVCIKSLEDAESYVYLASIQTIVSIVDILPSLSMPILVDAVVTGHMKLNDHHLNMSKDFILSSSQRIKCTEALIFSIRRRGDAIRSYGGILMNSILHGKSCSNNGDSGHDFDSSSNIQRETDIYFRPNKTAHIKFDEYALPSDSIEEQQVRLKTGGPVFDSEEVDVVRAACISVLSELISTIHPTAVEKYCFVLVKLGLNALRLDHSRVVRRSAAFLCRELYSCAFRELEEIDVHAKVVDACFSIALVESNESLLWASLTRCVSGDDVDTILFNGSSSSVKDKTRLYDSATVARCQEALDIRNSLQESGLLRLIEAYVKQYRDADRNPIARLLKKEDNSTIKPALDISNLNM